MKRYTDEAEACPFCDGDQIIRDVDDILFMSNDLTLPCECEECGARWDVLYRAISVLNEEGPRK